MPTQTQVTTYIQEIGAWYYDLPESASTLKVLYGKLAYLTDAYIRSRKSAAPDAPKAPAESIRKPRTPRAKVEAIAENPAEEIVPKRRRGRPPKAASTTEAKTPRAKKSNGGSGTISLADAVLKCVTEGVATADTILPELKRIYGLTVRPNHLGIALTRHLNAGRVEKAVDGNITKWTPKPTGEQMANAA